MSQMMRGADLVVKTLEALGIEKVFTLSGNHIMPLFDAAVDSRVQLIHVRHEAAAVHMADAWARLSGQVGIAWVTGGPGHANALSALYTALASESPVVLLSGHAPLALLGAGAFQEMDQVRMAAPVTKASWVARDADSLATAVATAIRIAMSGRPGPVHLSLPQDVLDAAVAVKPPDRRLQELASAPSQPLHADVAQSVVRDLAQAKRPLVLVGPQACTAQGGPAIAALQRTLRVPVVAMESPRGINDPSLGALGNRLAQADQLVLIGKKLDFTLKFGDASVVDPGCRIVQIDPDPAVCQRTLQATAGGSHTVRAAVADTGCALRALAEAALSPAREQRDWFDAVQAALAYRPREWAGLQEEAPGVLHPVAACRAVQQVLDNAPDAILISDGGEFGQWAQACLQAPRRIINGPAGAIGAALPFAAAARLVERSAPIIAMTGDGAAGFHAAEFDTAVRYGLPLVLVVGNDACWNAEYQIQLRRYGEARALGCQLLPARYDRLAEALGGHGEYVEGAGNLQAALARAVECGAPACVNVPISRHAAPAIRLP